MYFRVEDENGLSPNLREYGYSSLSETKVSADMADTLIANEIRCQVNNCKHRKVFSYSKSLGTVLFKYNDIADNPIHLYPIHIPKYEENCVEFDFINDYGWVENSHIPYNLENLNYPLQQRLGNKEIFLKNYIIDISNDKQLDEYLRHYTKIGKKKLASCEKDNEVIIRHVADDYVIAEYIDAVYLIYALRYKTDFLNINVMNALIEIFNEEIKNKNEKDAFGHLIFYLYYYWNYEEKISKTILEEKRKEGRVKGCYDSYYLALAIMNEDIKAAYIDCQQFPCSRLVKKIWGIYWEYSN